MVLQIAIGSLLSRFGPPPYHEKHFNSLRDSECKAAAAAAEEVAAKVLKEVERWGADTFAVFPSGSRDIDAS